MSHLTLDRATWIEVSCDDLKPDEHIRGNSLRECDHTTEEHFAFDSGVFAGEQEAYVNEARNPYSSDQGLLYEAWETGYSITRSWEPRKESES